MLPTTPLLLLAVALPRSFQSSYTAPFHGQPCTLYSGWETFTQANGAANAPDDPNTTSTTSAVYQTVPGGVITGAGNIDNQTSPPNYRIAETVPADLQEVVLQVSINLNQVNWANVRLSYVDAMSVTHLLPATSSQYLVFQMGHEERLMSWDLSGVADTILAYEVNVQATNTFTQLDAVKLDSRFACCPAPLAYCTSGTTTNGCLASIGSSGTPSVSASSGFVLTVSSVEGQKQGILFYGVSGQAAVPWGLGSSSFLCVKTPTQRMGTQNAGGTLDRCDGVLAIDWSAFIAANPTSLGTPFSVGDVVQAQGWFRDPPAPKTTSLSNAIEFTLCP
jgi:lysozyme family protein